jgi:PST family polysaccharide transporter
MARGEMARSIARGAFYLTIEKVANLASGTLYSMLLYRWLGPTKLGMMGLALACVGFATTATANSEVFLERYAAEYEERGMIRTLRRAFQLTLGIKLGLGVIASLVLLALSPWLATFFHTPELATLVPLLVLMVAFDGFGATGRATLVGVQQYRWVAALSILFNLAKTLLVGGLWWGHRGLPELAAGLAGLTVVHGMLSALVPMWMLRRAEDRSGTAPPSPRELFRSMVRYCGPLLGARITFTSGQNLSTLVVGKLFDNTLVGYFFFAFRTVERFVEVAYTAPSSLLPPLTQLVVRGEHERLRNVFDESLRLVQVMACALVFLLFAFARELTVVIAGHLFEPAIPVLRVLALVPMFRTAQQPLTMLFQAMRQPGIVLRLAVVKFVAEFGSYFALVPLAGLVGAAWANWVGATIAYAGALAALHTRLPGGSGARLYAQARCLGLLLPLLAIAAFADRALGPIGGLVLRLVLVPVGWIGIFGFGLVTGTDLEAIAAMPLSAAPMRTVRDAGVRFVDRFVRTIKPWRML